MLSAYILLVTVAGLVDAQQLPWIQNQNNTSKLPSPSKNLGDTCAIDHDCMSCYSSCVAATGTTRKSCQCRDGFRANANKGTCEPIVLECPVGDPLKGKDGQAVLCTVTQVNQSASQVNQQPGMTGMAYKPPIDSCQAGYYCLLHSSTTYRPVEEGHCCPRPKRICPSGAKPDPTKSCDSTSYFYYTQGEANQCTGTHACVSSGSQLGNGPSEPAICCPQACSMGDFAKNGKCLSYMNLGESCTDDEQCAQMGGTCATVSANSNKKVCICQKGMIASQYGGYCFTPQCYSPTGIASAPQLKDGDVLRCRNATDCANGFCNSENVCCPRPLDPACPDGHPAGDACTIDYTSNGQQPTNANMQVPTMMVDQCTRKNSNTFCMFSYMSMENGKQTTHGHCCGFRLYCPSGMVAETPAQSCSLNKQSSCPANSQCVQAVQNSPNQIPSYICCSQAPAQGSCRVGSPLQMNGVNMSCMPTNASCPAGYNCEFSSDGNTYHCCPAVSAWQGTGNGTWSAQPGK